MENLYTSLYEGIVNGNPRDTNDVGTEIIRTVNGHTDLISLSKYYSIEEYNKYIKTVSQSYFNILHLNIRSLQKNFDNLTSLLECLANPTHIIALSETWLKDSTQHLYNLKGYEAYHTCRTNREHGGISIYICSDIYAKPIQQYTSISEDIEMCTVKLNLTTNLIFSVIYRPHSKQVAVDEFTHTLNNILAQDLFTRNNTVLLGDFNINLLEHSSHQPTNYFLNSMQTMNYFPHISRPTRFPDNPDLGQPSLLDHIWTNFTPLSTSGIFHHPISDHLPIFLNIILMSDPCTKHKITYRVFDTTKHNLFTTYLAATNWNALLNSNDIDKNFGIFSDTLHKSYNAYFPKVTNFVSAKRLSSPWLTPGILNSVKHKSFI